MKLTINVTRDSEPDLRSSNNNEMKELEPQEHQVRMARVRFDTTHVAFPVSESLRAANQAAYSRSES
jgi:hypothetical protein